MKRLVALILLMSLLIGCTGYMPAEQAMTTGVQLDDYAEPMSELRAEPELPVKKLHPRVSRLREAVTDLTDLVEITDEQFAYLLSLQDETGIITQTPAQRKSIPYFANMAALAMLSRREGHEPVRRYLEWYLRHLNMPDKHKLVGTIYDYVKSDDAWIPTYGYDSADSYAATFMSLLLNYARATSDLQFMVDNFQQITDAAEVLIKLQDKDGLIWAKPGYYVKFLMDNAENYRGLEDASALMQALGRDDLAERYGLAAIRVAAGVEEQLWLEREGVYAWAMYGRWWARRPARKWYPDTVAQVYPIVFGLVAPESERAISLYSYLNQQYPKWMEGDFDDRFPWTILALVATQMDDDGRALVYLRNVNAQLVVDGKDRYPWHAFEAAFFLKAWQLLGTKHIMPNVAEEQDPEEPEAPRDELSAGDAALEEETPRRQHSQLNGGR